MKKGLMVFSLLSVLSVNAHALDGVVGSTLLPSDSTLISSMSFGATTSGEDKRQAHQIIAEAQEYLQTKDKGILISKKVEELQEEQDMSDDEAVDLLLERALEILN